MVLAQQKLDVKEKKRANLFNWRGQFTPELVHYLLSEMAVSNQTILDPFVGSGTVLLECGRKNLNSIGFEINPAAYAMAKFYTLLNASIPERQEYLKKTQEAIKNALFGKEELVLWLEKEDYREKYRNLLEFCSHIFSKVTDPIERILFMNIFFIAENSRINHLKTSLFQAFDYMEKSLLSLPQRTVKTEVKLGDARETHLFFKNEIDIILTSPPYINVFNYHQNHRAIVETAGWNVLKVAESEIGSNRKNRTNRFRTVVQYALDIELALHSFSNSLKNNGLLIMVLGRESNVRQVPFYNGAMVKDLIKEMACFGEINNFERTFKNKFGNSIKEDIIIGQKINTCENLNSKATKIAQKHLELGFDWAKEDLQKQEIKEVLSNIDSLQASPIFKLKDIFSHA